MRRLGSNDPCGLVSCTSEALAPAGVEPVVRVPQAGAHVLSTLAPFTHTLRARTCTQARTYTLSHTRTVQRARSVAANWHARAGTRWRGRRARRPAQTCGHGQARSSRPLPMPVSAVTRASPPRARVARGSRLRPKPGAASLLLIRFQRRDRRPLLAPVASLRLLGLAAPGPRV